MTNHSSLELVNRRHTCYLAMAAWLSNFCHGFSLDWRLDTFSFKMDVSTNKVKSFENPQMCEKNGCRVSRKAFFCSTRLNIFVSCFKALEIFRNGGQDWIFFILFIYFFFIEGLLRFQKINLKFFSSSILATLPWLPSLQSFIRYFYYALSTFAPKMKLLS